jgi:hypothetical protein
VAGAKDIFDKCFAEELNRPPEKCYVCGSENAFGSLACKSCGAPFGNDTEGGQIITSFAEKPTKAHPIAITWHPGIAALLSFLIPGAGQIYKTNLVGGLCFFSLAAFCNAYWVHLYSNNDPGLAPMLGLGIMAAICVHVWAIVDAAYRGRK